VLPVLWVAFFFRPCAAIAIVICVGLAHGLVLLSLPATSGSFDHWLNVMVAVSAVAAIISVLARRNAELARLAGEARMDTLTALLNRRGFEERAAVELAHSRREGRPIAVASFDVDYFKRVNAEWGHEIGDRVLARVGSVLASNSREVDVVARIGGEEFLALLPGATSAEAEAFTQRVRHALATPDPSALPAVGVSAGVAAASAPANVQELLQKADRALYAAKRAGRGHTRTFGYLTPRVTGVPSSRLAPAIRASRGDAGHASRAG
jgi:diguanylate cyclase (GGDEF)-like protein